MSNVCLSLLAAACGGSAPRQPDELFHRIQAHEQRIALAQAELERAARCEEARPPSQAVCEESAELCQLALQSGDRDAQARCQKASDACTTARERGQLACAT